MPIDLVKRYLETRRRRDFAALVRATRGEVLDAAYRVLGDRARAEDVAQDVFLGLLKTPRAAGEVRSGRGYLVALATSRARDAARGERRRTDREQATGGGGDGGGGGGELAERAEEVRAAVDALPDELRRCVELRYFGGLPVAEVARALGWAPRTTSQRLSQARERLAARLAATGFAPLLAVLANDGAEGALPHLAPSAEWTASLERIARDGVPLARVAAGRGVASPAALAGGAAAVVLAAAAALVWTGRDADGPDGLEAAQPKNGPIALAESEPSVRPAPVSPVTAPEGRAATGVASAEVDALPRLEIEVLTPAGAPVRRGVLELDLALFQSIEDLEALEPWAHHLGEHDLSAANPLVFEDLPAAAAGLALEVSVRDTGYPTVAVVPLELRGDEPTRLRIDLLAPTGVVAFVVDHATGEPVEGALVFAPELLEANGHELRGVRALGIESLGADSGPGWALTGADGRTTLDGLGELPAEIEVALAGRAPCGGVARAPGETVRVLVPPPFPRASLEARVLGPGGEPLAGVEVRHSALGVERSARTGLDGIARLEGLCADETGHVSLEATSFAELLHARGWSASESGIAFSLRAPLWPEETGEVTLGFLPAAADVLVEVVDTGGAPVPGEDVELSGSVLMEATTGDDGVARFEGVPAGRYSLGFAGFFGSWSSDAEVEVAPGSPIRARLVRGTARIEGRIVIGPDGAPAPRAVIMAMGAVTAMTWADGAGRFSFEHVPPGVFRLSSGSGDGYAGGAAAVEVLAGDGVVDVMLVAPLGWPLEVVLDPSLGDVRPSLAGADGSEPVLRPSAAEPRVWRTPALSAGRYTLRVELPDGSALERAVEVLSGTPTRVELP